MNTMVRTLNAITCVLMMVCAALVPAMTVCADSITLAGSSIPLKGCEVKAISGATLVYADARGQRQMRPIEQVAAIGFDALPTLESGEALAAADDYEGAIIRLLEALADARTDTQRTWIHARLARCHDLAGDYVQSAGHVARVFLADEHAWWASLAPVCRPNQPPYPAAREAMDALQMAARRVRNAELVSAIDRMLKVVGPALENAAIPSDHAGNSTAKTFSGYTHEEIVALADQLTSRLAAAAADRPDTIASDRPAPAAAATPTPPPLGSSPTPTGSPPPATAGSSPPAAPSAAQNEFSVETITALLSAGRFTQAASACERALRAQDGRDQAQLLHQLGSALAGMGESDAAAVRWTQAALLHPHTTWGCQALIDTAVVYRDHFNDVATARRLLERALALAQSNEHIAQARIAQDVLQRLK